MVKGVLRARGFVAAAGATVWAAVGAMIWSVCGVIVSPGAMAAEGQPSPYQIDLQPAATPVAEQMHDFHNFLMVIITGIALFVLALLVICILRFNEKANPIPSKATHNTLLEMAWTVVPIIILMVIAIPSFKLLYAQYEFPKPDLVVKATGHQWYWSYEYPDLGDVSFDSMMLEDNERKPGQPRLLAVDNEIVVPVGKVVHMLVTATDVIHNWTIPSFGSKIDAVPGRITATWFKVRRKGVYYGQCSELCGMRHAFMPIAVRVVGQDVFDRWIAAMKADETDKAKAILSEAERDRSRDVAALAAKAKANAKVE